MDRKILLILIVILVIIACVGVYSFSLNPSFEDTNLTTNNTTNATNLTINNSTVNSNSSNSNNGSDSLVSSDKSSLNNNDTYYEMVNGEKHYMSESEYAEKYPEIYKERKEGKFQDVA
ncbi:hypothetical protein BGI41_01615 [Methanobrevibacter sp. 87.7]|uniref:hypothetical protein n=1 Tax=Methanobrevibacter sp. 87.7 TaxID=387957 RepID=UPI000B503F4E|nr:hypothetical protein [Methanobrevibacter sp. 87.7]OWT33579.1 hypothetical protein BGI41_01615 [Methanobrevibacter sp. 87.7]